MWTPVKFPPGIVRQSTPYDSPGRWWDGNNVRWISGALAPIGGNTRITATPIAGNIRKLFQWRDNGGTVWIFVGRENGVSVIPDVPYDITPANFTALAAISSHGGYGAGPYGVDLDPGTSVTITNASPGVVSWTAHELAAGDTVRFTAGAGVLPAEITSDVVYYVAVSPAPSANAFSISATAGGAAINTSGGSGTVTGWFEGYGTGRSTTNPPQFTVLKHWTVSTFGQDILAVASWDGRLLHYAPSLGAPGTLMDVPSNAPISNTAVVVSAERAAVLIGAGGNPRQVAWSDLEDYNGWTFNSPTGQAGYLDLESTSALVTGIRVKEGILILSQHEAFLMRYVGAPYFYGIEKLGSTTFTAPYALAAAGNQAMWLGTESYWEYDGGAIRPVDCPNFNDFKQDLDPTYGWNRATMHANELFPEFWLDYPSVDNTDGENDSYMIYNYATEWWGLGNRSRTAAAGAITAQHPIASSTEGHIYQHEDGWTDDGVARIGKVWVESGVLNAGGDGMNLDIMQGMFAQDPHLSTQNYRIWFFSRMTPSGVEYSWGPFLPRLDGYTDCRISGRDIRIRLENTKDAYWSLGQFRLDIETGKGGSR